MPKASDFYNSKEIKIALKVQLNTIFSPRKDHRAHSNIIIAYYYLNTFICKKRKLIRSVYIFFSKMAVDVELQ